MKSLCFLLEKEEEEESVVVIMLETNVLRLKLDERDVFLRETTITDPLGVNLLG